MIEYIKAFIISFVSSLFAPVAASSSAVFAFLENILGFSQNKDESVFYFSLISVAFSLVSLFYVRKIYAKGFKAVFSKKSIISNAKNYKSMMIGVVISLIPCILMVIPVSENKLVLDYFANYLWKSNILVSAFCQFAMGFVIIIAAWFVKIKNTEKHRNSRKTDVLRLTIYQIIAYIFPGLSHVSLSATGLIVSGVEESVIMRDVLIYISPSMLVISIMRIIRALLLGVSVDAVKVLICIISALLGNILMLKFVSRAKIKKSFVFFSVYSIVFGIFMIIASLFIL